VNQQWFGPFGRRLDTQGRDLPRNVGVPEGLRVGFTGHEQEDTLGLVDMRGRYYDPTQRRFLTTDPVIASPLSTQGFSPYAYVSNNPLSRIDPTGFTEDGFDDYSRPGSVDEGPWDTSGMDDQAPPDTIAGGGGNPGYDDPGADFDPGESMAGQDEEGGNDGTDDYSDSGVGKGPPVAVPYITGVDAAQALTGIMRFGHWGGSNERGEPFTDGVDGLEGEFFDVEEHHPYDSTQGGREYLPGDAPAGVTAPTVSARRQRPRRTWRSHFLYSQNHPFRVTVRITVRSARRPTPARVTRSRWQWQARRDSSEPNDRLVPAPVTEGGSMIGENTVRFREVRPGEYSATITLPVSGDWRFADRFAVDMRPGYEVSASASVGP
jgi:RHS repeat-associated protein